MHAHGDLPPHDRPAGRWPDDDPDPDWPDDWPTPAGPEPSPRRRGPRITALILTALVALGAGAGAVYVYQHGTPRSSPAAAGSSAPGPDTGRGGMVTGMVLFGPVRAIGRDSVTIGGGPEPEISALVTSATQFTGSARSLAQVRVGDTVAAQISESNGVARVVSLQDPATA